MSTFTQAEINSSILLSIKKAIVGPPEYTPFDADLIMHINSQIANLYQLGLDSAKSVVVDGADQLWTDLIPAGDSRLQFVRTYVYARVKMIFDPPTSTAQMQALKDAAAEAEFRISTAVDKPYDDLDPASPVATGDHSMLKNRDLPNQHPIKAITNLDETIQKTNTSLNEKLNKSSAMSQAQIDDIINKARWKKVK
nr:MAG TPA: hypothetical protein [Caudoviricetes sp.]